MQYSQGLAGRSMFPQRQTTNPTLAGAAVLGKRVTRAGVSLLKRRAYRRSFHRGNPAPAILGAVAGLGGVPKLGKRVDPKKHAQRLAVVQAQAGMAAAGNEEALRNLQGIAQGVQWPGQWADIAAAAQAQYNIVVAQLEATEGKRAGKVSAAAAREARFLQAGADIAGTLGSAVLSRGRLPRKRKKAKRRTYPAGY